MRTMRIALAAAAIAVWPGVARAQKLEGVWLSETSYGPSVRGELRVQQDVRSWTAEIASLAAVAPRAGDSVHVRFAGDIGEFLGKLSADRGTIRGFWIQQASPVYGYRFATPVTLRGGKGAWRGDIEPWIDRYSLYIWIWRNADATLSATIRNPQLNDRFRSLVFSVRNTGDSIAFVVSDSELKASYDSSSDVMRLRWPANQQVLTFRRIEEAAAVGLFPRIPRGATRGYRKPPQLADGWTTATAGSVGMDENVLANLVRAIADTIPDHVRFPAVNSILVARHGKLILEEYFAGFDRDQTHDIRSAGKSFSNAMLGALMQRGYNVSEQTRLTSFTKPLGPLANPDPRKDLITLGHLMTHSTGLACDDNEDDSPGNENRLQSQHAQPNYWKYMLDLPMIHDPGTYYGYCSGTMNLMGAAITAISRKWLPDAFDDYVARPLQFGRYHWNLAPDKQGYLGGGAFLRPRDFLKIGQLYLSEGVWNGKRMIPAAWIRTSTTKHMEWPQRGENVSAGQDGYGWHLNAVKSGGKTYSEYEANGNGGQLLMIVPELDLVVVFTAANYAQGGVWHWFRDNWLSNVIIAAARTDRTDSTPTR